MSNKSTGIINFMDAERCKWCGDTIPHRFRGCTKGLPQPNRIENKLEYASQDNKMKLHTHFR